MSAPFRMLAISGAATVVAVAAVVIGAVGTGPRIERSYAEAFERLDEAQATAIARSAGRLDPAHLHLSRLPAVASAAPALAVGDRITLAAREGGVVNYEVIEVRALPGAIAGAALQMSPADPASRLMLVTAVSSDTTKARTVRFIVDADAPAESALPGMVTRRKTARALRLVSEPDDPGDQPGWPIASRSSSSTSILMPCICGWTS